MLLYVSLKTVTQRCDVCGTAHHVAFHSLCAGLACGDPPVPRDPNIIALPTCPTCGAREFLNRVVVPATTASMDTADHRRGVNALHAALVAAGSTAPGLRDWFAQEHITTDTANIPWSFAGTPPRPSGPPNPTRVAFAQYAAHYQGGV